MKETGNCPDLSWTYFFIRTRWKREVDNIHVRLLMYAFELSLFVFQIVNASVYTLDRLSFFQMVFVVILGRMTKRFYVFTGKFHFQSKAQPGMI